MRTALDPLVAAKLARICALFSSDVSGERGAAAWQADKLLKAAGLDWTDVFAPAPAVAWSPAPTSGAPAPHVAEARWALRFQDRLNAWEQQFLADLARRRRITIKQSAVLDGILHKLRQSSAG